MLFAETDFGNSWILVAMTAAGGLIATFWSYFKNFFQQVRSRVVATNNLDGMLRDAMRVYCWKELKASRFGIRTFMGYFYNIRSLGRMQVVPFEIVREGRLFWKGWRPLWVSAGESEESPRAVGDVNKKYAMSVTFFRGTFNIDQLVIDIAETYNRSYQQPIQKRMFFRQIFGTVNKPANNSVGTEVSRSLPDGTPDPMSFQTCRLLKGNPDDMGPNTSMADGETAVSRLALGKEAKDLVADLHFWKQSEGWYRERNITWRHSAAMVGDPGNGKTSLVRAVAVDMDLPVFVYHLATMYDDEFAREWTSMLNHAPCVALLEDLDTVFEGRKRVAGELSFEILLNCIDGLEQANGILLFVTTNREEMLDPALMRYGRINSKIRMDNPSRAGRMIIAQRILFEHPEILDRTVDEGANDSGAQFEGRCRQLAEHLYWSEHRERFDLSTALNGRKDVLPLRIGSANSKPAGAMPQSATAG